MFIVDDSAVVRMVLTEALEQATGIEVIGTAQDPIFAKAKMEKDWPDVIILDVEMPRMDGITFLKNIMSERPTPVVMCSTLTEQGSKTSLQALSLGAIEVIAKPKTNLKTNLSSATQALISAVRVASKANIKGTRIKPIVDIKKVPSKLSADAMLSRSSGANTKSDKATATGALIAIGASTGGTQALEALLKSLPANNSPIIVVQHMPENFTKTFAERLDKLCKMTVKEAENNDSLVTGRVLIAPGGKHMMLQGTRFGVSVVVKDGPLVNRHKPSVDVMFRSVSKFAAKQALGVILTGMGDDGALGMKEMHDSGAKTIAQNEATCVVYGMPNEAVKLGAVDYELALEKIPEMIALHR